MPTLSSNAAEEERPEPPRILGNLATTYGDLGDHKKELDLNEKVYNLRLKVLGEGHPDTLLSLNNLAITYGDLGDLEKEIELMEKVYTLSCKVLGEEHPDTLEVKDYLKKCREKLDS